MLIDPNRVASVLLKWGFNFKKCGFDVLLLRISRRIIRVKQIAKSRAVYSFVSIHMIFAVSFAMTPPTCLKTMHITANYQWTAINHPPYIWERARLASLRLSFCVAKWKTTFVEPILPPAEDPQNAGGQRLWEVTNCHIEGSCDLSETRMVLKQKYKRHAPLI